MTRRLLRIYPGSSENCFSLTVRLSRRSKTYLDFRMIRSNTKSYQAERHWQMLIHIHHRILNLGHHLVGSVKACRSGANDRHSKRSSIVSSRFLCICSSLSNDIRPKWYSSSSHQCGRTSCTNPRSRNSIHFPVLTTSFNFWDFFIANLDKEWLPWQWVCPYVPLVDIPCHTWSSPVNSCQHHIPYQIAELFGYQPVNSSTLR